MSVEGLLKCGFSNRLDKYSSHLPVLAACVAATKGAVVEIGAGIYSTPVLHGMCLAAGRGLVTVENQVEWREFLAGYLRPGHAIVEQLGVLARGRWSVAFIDSDDFAEREAAIRAMAETAELIVVHDTQEHDFTAAFAGFAQVFRVKPHPWPVETAVVSALRDLAFLKEIFPGGSLERRAAP